MEYKTDAVLDIQGNAVFNASIRALTKSRQLATVYDASGVQIPNPVSTDKTGEYSLALPNGEYYLEISFNGTLYETRGPVTFFDPKDERTSVRDFGALGKGVADDTAAFSSASSAAAAAGVPLVIPPGVYIVDGWSIPAIDVIGSGETTVLKRKSGSAVLNMISASNISGFSIKNLTIDGNRANQTVAGNNLVVSGCWDFTLSNIHTKNALAIAGNGNGAVILSTADAANGTRSIVKDIRANNCGGVGLLFRTGGKRITFKDISAWGNGGTGFSIDGRVFPATPDVFQQVEVDGVNVWGNGGSGFAVGGYAIGGTMSVPVYGSGSDPCSQSTFRNIAAYENGQYGIVLQVTDCTAQGLYGFKNGGTGTTYAGLLANSTRTKFASMHFDENEFYGVDCGGSIDCTFEDFQCRKNGIRSTSNFGSGFNYGGSIGLRGINGRCELNGGSNGGIQFFCMRQEGAGNGYGFFYEAARCSLKDCTAEISNVNMVGFRHSEDPADCEWIDCRVVGAGANDENSFQNESMTSRVVNCQHGTGNSTMWPSFSNGFLSTSTLVVADNLESIVINAGGSPITMQSIYTRTTNRLLGRVTKVTLSNAGAGYTSQPTVTFSGGGGSGAVATALLKGDGTLSGIQVTSGGSGYTGTPTVTLSGGGATTQAVGVAAVGCVNFNGRQINILFGSGGPVTVAHGGLANGFIRLAGATSYLTALNDNLSVRAWNGTWRETSRLDN